MSLLDTASLVLTPNGYKADKLYSVKPTNGDGDMVVSRNTTATRVNSAGLIESVAINVPRLDYTGGGCPSILVEPARTNNVLRSEEFDNAYWFKSAGVTVTPNTTTAPDGTMTADNLNITAISGYLRRLGLTFANSTSYTISIFVKKSATTGTKNFRFYYNNNEGSPISSSFTCTVDLTNITATTTTNGTIPPTILSTKLVNYGNNWYRVEVAFTTSALGGSSNSEIGLQPPGGGPVVDFDAWGAQVETGTYATSYIPTVASTITRNADVISKTGISSLIGQTEGTLYAEVIIKNTENQICASIQRDGGINYIFIAQLGNKRQFVIKANSVIIFSYNVGVFLSGTNKVALVYNTNGNISAFLNGVKVSTLSTSAFAFSNTLDSLQIFDDGYYSSQNTTNNKSTILFKTALTDGQAISLTTL